MEKWKQNIKQYTRGIITKSEAVQVMVDEMNTAPEFDINFDMEASGWLEHAGLDQADWDKLKTALNAYEKKWDR